MAELISLNIRQERDQMLNDFALLTWTENDTQFWVGGDLTPEQAIIIADSLQ